MATSDKTGPDDEAVEGSWSPKRTKQGKAAPSPDPEVLADEIEKTREELAETLDAIADKVSPKRVTARTKKAAKDGAADAVESVKETVVAAKDAAKEKVTGQSAPAVPLAAAEVPVEVAPTPSSATAPAYTPTDYTSTLPPAAPSRAPMYAGAAAAALVAFWLLRRGRR